MPEIKLTLICENTPEQAETIEMLSKHFEDFDCLIESDGTVCFDGYEDGAYVSGTIDRAGFVL